jgi:hypothetical protein
LISPIYFSNDVRWGQAIPALYRAVEPQHIKTYQRGGSLLSVGDRFII